jgi:hypothetical protein
MVVGRQRCDFIVLVTFKLKDLILSDTSHDECSDMRGDRVPLIMSLTGGSGLARDKGHVKLHSQCSGDTYGHHACPTMSKHDAVEPKR